MIVAILRKTERRKQVKEVVGKKRQFRGQPSGAYPTFFRALMSAANHSGEPNDFIAAGYELCRHAYDLLDDDQEQAAAEFRKLWRTERKGSVAIVAWFEYYFPRSMADIPDDKRIAFTEGVYQATEDGKSELV